MIEQGLTSSDKINKPRTPNKPNPIPNPQTPFKVINHHVAILVLKTVCETKPDFVDRYAGSLVKLLHKMVKDSIAGPATSTAKPGAKALVVEDNKLSEEVALQSLVAALRVLSHRILYLEDQRKA